MSNLACHSQSNHLVRLLCPSIQIRIFRSGSSGLDTYSAHEHVHMASSFSSIYCPLCDFACSGHGSLSIAWAFNVLPSSLPAGLCLHTFAKFCSTRHRVSCLCVYLIAKHYLLIQKCSAAGVSKPSSKQ